MTGGRLNNRWHQRCLKWLCCASTVALGLGAAGPMMARAQEPAAAAAQARAAPDKFYVAAFDVAGAKLLDPSLVEAAVYDFTGPDRTAADIEAARKALEDAYKKRGYEAVQIEIPPQPEAMFAQGIVQLRVAEAPIGRVQVTGSRYHSLKVVRDNLPSVVEGQVLNTKALETDLANANRFPDRSVSPSFKAGAVPGTIDVDLAVEDSLPLHGSLELNNDHSPSTVPLRASASLRYSDLWQRGHMVTATYIAAPQDRKQSEVFSGSYSAPLLGSPWTLILYGYKSNSNVAALGGVNVLGNGYQMGARAVYRLPGKASAQNVTFGFDYKNFKQNISLSSQLTAQAPIEYMPLFASYGFSSGTDKANLDINVSVTAGLRAFKKIRCFEVDPANCSATTQFDQFKNHDFDSNENFVHANFDLAYKRAFLGDFVAAAKLYGQIADSHLVTNEQFAIGGLASLRGYFQSEAVGDMGYAVSLELGTPSLAPKLPDFVDELRLFGFVEHGQTRIIHPQPGQTASQSLLSVGGGGRIKLFKHVSGELSVGVPLKDGPSTKANAVRTTFSAKSEF